MLLDKLHYTRNIALRAECKFDHDYQLMQNNIFHGLLTPFFYSERSLPAFTQNGGFLFDKKWSKMIVENIFNRE